MKTYINIGDAIVAAIKANADMVSQVGGNISSTYASFAALASGVWITFTSVSSINETAHDGDQDLTQARFQFNVGSPNKPLADLVSQLFINEFNGTEFIYTDAHENSYKLTFIHLGEHEQFSEPPRMYEHVIDFRIWYNPQPLA